jgi:exopolysaccharide production protein ExoZ
VIAAKRLFVQNRRLDAVQGLRALAALLVVVAHSILSLVEKAGLDPAYQRYGWTSGELGVRIFFAVSGFIMVYTSSSYFSQSGASQTFLRKRFFRVTPLYYITTIVYCGKLALQNSLPGAKDIFLSLLFIPYINAMGLFRPVYGLGWTLNYEMFFYLLFSLALFLRFQPGVIVISSALVSLVLGGIYLQFGAAAGFWVHWFIFVSDPIMIYFAIGIVVGYLRVRMGFSITSWPVPTALFVCFLMSMIVVAGRLSNRSLFVVMLITATACIALTGLHSPSSEESKERFPSRIIRSLGDASYSIYLTHSFLVGPAARGWGLMFERSDNTWPLFVIAMLIGCSILGLMTYRFVEKPAVDFFRRRTSRQLVLSSGVHLSRSAHPV